MPTQTAQGRNSVLSAAVRHCRRRGLFWLCPITAAAAHAHAPRWQHHRSPPNLQPETLLCTYRCTA